MTDGSNPCVLVVSLTYFLHVTIHGFLIKKMMNGHGKIRATGIAELPHTSKAVVTVQYLQKILRKEVKKKSEWLRDLRLSRENQN